MDYAVLEFDKQQRRRRNSRGEGFRKKQKKTKQKKKIFSNENIAVSVITAVISLSFNMLSGLISVFSKDTILNYM